MKKAVLAILFGGTLSASAAFGAFAAVSPDQITLTDPQIDVDGNATWVLNGSVDSDATIKYQLELSRQKNGTTKDAYKSVTMTTDDSSDTEYDFHFSTTGRYRFRVRARFLSPDEEKWTAYTNWSDYSDFVIVSKGDLNGSDWDDDWDANSDANSGNYGPGYTANGTLVNAQSPEGTTTGNGPGYTYQIGQNSGVNQGNAPTAAGAQQNYGWVKDANGWWYRHQDGSYPRSSWQHINDKWYFFNAQGYMQTSWIFWNNSWYYALPDGPMATDWQNINEKWYYFNEAGIMLTGYQTIGGKTYFLDASGVRFTNGTTPDGHTFDANGVMVK